MPANSETLKRMLSKLFPENKNMKNNQEENAKEFNKDQGEGKLSHRDKKFVEAMVDPKTKSQTEAAIKAGYSPKTARTKASQKLTKVNIREEIEKRKKELAKLSNICDESIIGAAARVAFASIDDAFDDNGHFDIEKARQTGAINLIKSIRRTPTKYGESVSIEFYSASEARKELAEYLGIKQLPRENEQRLQTAVNGILAFLEMHPDYDIDKAVHYFARARSLDADVLKEKVLEAMETVH